jgi:raffinose/stachyose/melibiose transport system substrate-binding protein
LEEKMKKTKCLAWLIIAMLMSGAALFAGGQQGQSSGTTINLWHIHTQELRKIAIENAVKRFEAANPGVKVVISVYENDPYKTKLKTVSGGDFPDVFHSWGGGWLQSFVDAGLVADITEEARPWRNKVSQEYLAMNTFNGKLYASPAIGGSTILFYNKALFDKYGLKFPTNWAEMTNAANTFIRNGVYPFALGNKSMWPGAQHFVMLAMRYGGPDIWQKVIGGKTNFSDPAFIKAGDTLQQMVKDGWFPEGVNGINYDTGGSRMMFYTEQCAMILQTAGFAASCKAENLDFFTNKLGIGVYPAIEGYPGKTTDMLAGENAFSVSASSKNKAMAAKLVEFLSTDPTFQQDIVESGALPALLGIKAQDPRIAGIISANEVATFMQNYIDQTLSPTLAEIHKSTTQALYGGTMNSQQVAATMQKAFDEEK